MVGDKIAISTEDPALKERLLRVPKLDLQKAVDISQSSEQAHKEFVSMKGAAETEEQQVDVLNTDRPHINRASTGGRGARNRGRRQSCVRRSATHARNECPDLLRSKPMQNGRSRCR